MSILFFQPLCGWGWGYSQLITPGKLYLKTIECNNYKLLYLVNLSTVL